MYHLIHGFSKFLHDHLAERRGTSGEANADYNKAVHAAINALDSLLVFY